MEENKALAKEVVKINLTKAKDETLTEEERKKCLIDAGKAQELVDKMEENDLNKAKLEMEQQKQKHSHLWGIAESLGIPVVLLFIGYVLDKKKTDYAWSKEQDNIPISTATKSFMGGLFRKK